MRKILLIVVALLGISTVARGDTFTTFGTRAAQNPTDIFDWTQLGPDGTTLATPQLVTSFGGAIALVGNVDGTSFSRADEGTSWVGNFDFGQALLTSNGSVNPMALEMGVPLSSIGFDVQGSVSGAFAATVVLFDASLNPLTTQSFSGTSNTLENGSALFVGLGDLTGANIGAMEIVVTDANGNAESFAIDDVSFTTGQVTTPEPGSLLLLGIGLGGLAGLRRKLGNS